MRTWTSCRLDRRSDTATSEPPDRSRSRTRYTSRYHLWTLFDGRRLETLDAPRYVWRRRRTALVLSVGPVFGGR